MKVVEKTKSIKIFNCIKYKKSKTNSNEIKNKSKKSKKISNKPNVFSIWLNKGRIKKNKFSKYLGKNLKSKRNKVNWKIKSRKFCSK